MSPVPERFLADKTAPVCQLAIGEHFTKLTKQERLYAHHLTQSAWAGARIILGQTTAHAEGIFDLLLTTLTDAPGKATDLGSLHTRSGVSQEAFDGFLQYTAQFLSNLANYKSFGDTKFLPRCSEAEFRAVIGAATQKEAAASLLTPVIGDIYAAGPDASLLLGYPDEGHTTHYYTANVNKEEIHLVQNFLQSTSLEALNTRLFKDSANGVLEVRVASAQTTPAPVDHTYEGRKIRVVYGDFSASLEKAAEAMTKAGEYAANENQRRMIAKYAESFRTGSMEAHRESQKSWIRDVGPVVESNLGFVETYRDPAGVRAEWEGFVAMVNKEMTRKFGELVQRAPEYIPKLPWGKDFEKETFLKPDFTSLEVLSFCTGGVPAGINIPNYDDIRQTFGFKNVSLGNVLNAKAPGEVITFLSAEDRVLYEKLKAPAFEVQVGIHELLGHGTGKLLQEEKEGEFNFDRASPPISPLTGKPVTSWYGVGETYGGVFKGMASSYEECRAEAVAMLLSTDPGMLGIFGHENGKGETGSAVEADDVMYIGWLNMVRAGLLGLEFWDPKAGKWGQAHMQARWAITQVLLRAEGGKLAKVEWVGEEKEDLRVSVDREAIRGQGVEAMRRFLTQLQVYKATADVEGGTALYKDLTDVTSPEWLAMREVVLKKKQPRKILCQANTFLRPDGDVEAREYEASIAGVIQSFVERGI